MLKVLSDSGVRERVLHCTLVTDSRSLTSSQHNPLCDQLTLLQTLVIIHWQYHWFMLLQTLIIMNECIEQVNSDAGGGGSLALTLLTPGSSITLRHTVVLRHYHWALFSDRVWPSVLQQPALHSLWQANIKPETELIQLSASASNLSNLLSIIRKSELTIRIQFNRGI